MNRRHFLDTESLAQAAGIVLGPWIALHEPPPENPADVSLLRYSRRAMATLFELLIPYGQPAAAEIANDALDLIDQLESQLTVYRDDSEVSTINQSAHAAAVPVEEKLFALLELAARLTDGTWGAFDVTAGPLIKAWGFFRRQGRMPTPAERQEALNRVGMRHVELNRDNRSIRFRRPGVEINLGSIGKGYALDRVAEAIRSRGVGSALLHGGGSSVLAIGGRPGDGNGWPIGIRHPADETRRIATLHLRDRALGTSAATFQNFDYNKRKLGHLLDPRSGRPAEGIASASAVAPTAAEADALATAFYVLGVDKTRLYCQTRPEIGAILLPSGEDARLVAFNLDI